MTSSLVAFELRDALAEYLSTNLALSDDKTRDRLLAFLHDPEQGIFRGPFLRVRTPYQAAEADPDQRAPLDWLPDRFTPYRHQAAAFARLAARDGDPRPTLIAAAGPGRAECHLYPILDHCLREAARGRRGVKALLLYPSNALARQQARLLAGLLSEDPRLAAAGVTAGLYLEEGDSRRGPGPAQLTGAAEVLREGPPDLLLTNHEMLERLLLTPEHRGLWATAAPAADAGTDGRPHPLRYVVLEEAHAYGSAQATSTAVLLRRLGAALGVAEPGRPLGRAVPVVTTTALTAGASGTGEAAAGAVCAFASRVTGVRFDLDSVVEERRQGVEQATGGVETGVVVPTVREVLAVPDGDLDTLGMLFTVTRTPLDQVTLGFILRHHPLTHAVLTACAEQPRHWDEVAAQVDETLRHWVAGAPRWAPGPHDPELTADHVRLALARFVALLSHARRQGQADRLPCPRLLSGRQTVDSGEPEPLFDVQVQLWVRELTRLLRRVTHKPAAFRWLEDPTPEDPEGGDGGGSGLELPAAFCLHCGRDGWLALVDDDDQPVLDPAAAYRALAQDPARLRALVRAPARARALGTLRHLDAATGRITADPTPTSVPVLVTPSAQAAERAVCPSCDQRGGIRPLDVSVAALAAAAADALCGSELLEPPERRLLALAPSEQDAAHQAGLLDARAYRQRLRTALAGVVAATGLRPDHDDDLRGDEGGDDDGRDGAVPPAAIDRLPSGQRPRTRQPVGVRLDELGETLLRAAGASPEGLFALVPPDLRQHPWVRALWEGGAEGARTAAGTDMETNASQAGADLLDADSGRVDDERPDVAGDGEYDPAQAGRELLARRLGMEAALEFGCRARLGPTLELTGTLAAAVELDDFDHLVQVVEEAHRHIAGQAALDEPGWPGHAVYLRGLLERLRLWGALVHPWLDRYVQEGGNAYRIWGGRRQGMPAFPPGSTRPSFVTTGPGGASRGGLEPLTGAKATPTWLTDWAMRTVGADPVTARALNRRVFELLAAAEVLEPVRTRTGHTVYGLRPRNVVVHHLPGDPAGELPAAEAGGLLRCGACGARHAAPPGRLGAWVGTPCLRYRCPGRYQPAPADLPPQRRDLYRSRRPHPPVTAAEHTSLLTRGERAAVEERFTTGGSVDAPDVVVAAPSLRLGIDPADRSVVLLTGMPPDPAAFARLAGRSAGTGSALITVLAGAEPRGLQALAAPEWILAGAVTPPGVHLDTPEVLHRHYLGFLIDQAAAGRIAAPPAPSRMFDLAVEGLAPGSWLRTLLDAGTAPGNPHLEGFLGLLGGDIAVETAAALRTFTQGPLVRRVRDAVGAWRGRFDDLLHRRNQVKGHLVRIEGRAYPDEGERRADQRRFRGEHAALDARMRALRDQPTLDALAELGLLPDHTLLGDAATLDGALWSQDRVPAAGGTGTAAQVTTGTFSHRIPAGAALTDLAPGATLYARGHELTADHLHLARGAAEPGWWRLCPACGYGTPEPAPASGADRAALEGCPRCGDPSLNDDRARHLLVEPRRVEVTAERDRDHVADDRERRRWRGYQLVTAVDADPAGLRQAWQHRHAAFGVELLAGAAVRTVNLGPAGQPGTPVTVAGQRLTAPGLRVCRHCGAVAAPRPGGGADHRGWCGLRAGASQEAWDHLALLHDLRTDALRLLLPETTAAEERRLASVRSALLLGLRLGFGAAAEHLAAVVTGQPGTGGPRPGLVVYDRVPGGTGLLGRIAHPDRLRGVLDTARTALTLCPCAGHGLDGCHRCLLAALEPGDTGGSVSRRLALEVLDELLDRWELDQAPPGRGLAVSARQPRTASVSG